MKKYKMITRESASRMYNKHKSFIVCPCNCRPYDECAWKLEEWSIEYRLKIPFDRFLNNFVDYNCNEENGKGICFYMELT